MKFCLLEVLFNLFFIKIDIPKTQMHFLPPQAFNQPVAHYTIAIFETCRYSSFLRFDGECT